MAGGGGTQRHSPFFLRNIQKEKTVGGLGITEWRMGAGHKYPSGLDDPPHPAIFAPMDQNQSNPTDARSSG